MFSLIITVISIALVAALALATLYYGGAAFIKGSADAEASKIVLQGQQLLGAADLFFAERNRWPANREELVSEGYLKAIPQALLAPVTSAHAAGVEWDMAPAVPFFVLEDAVAADVCAAVNAKGSLRQRGILRQAYSSLNAQCFGEADSYKVVFKKFSSPDSLDPLPDEEVGGTTPPTYEDDPDSWSQPPGQPPTTPTEPATGDLGNNVSISPGGWTFTTGENVPVTRVFTVTNNGASAIEISDQWLDWGNFDLYDTENANDCSVNWELDAGESCQLTVRFGANNGNPTEYDELWVETYSVAADEYDTGYVQLNATVNIPPPPPPSRTHDLGTARVGDVGDSFHYTYTNNTGSPVWLYNFGAAESGWYNVFTFDYYDSNCVDENGYARVLNPGQSCDFDIWLMPQMYTGVSGYYEATIWMGIIPNPPANFDWDNADWDYLDSIAERHWTGDRVTGNVLPQLFADDFNLQSTLNFNQYVSGQISSGSAALWVNQLSWNNGADLVLVSSSLTGSGDFSILDAQDIEDLGLTEYYDANQSCGVLLQADCLFFVHFQSSGPGGKSATLSVTFRDGAGNEVTHTSELSANGGGGGSGGTGPDTFILDYESFTFDSNGAPVGAGSMGMNATQQTWNHGEDLVLVSVTITGSTDFKLLETQQDLEDAGVAAYYDLDLSCAVLQQTSCQLFVHFAPTVDGIQTATLTATFRDGAGNETSRTTELTGNGDAAGDTSGGGGSTPGSSAFSFQPHHYGYTNSGTHTFRATIDSAAAGVPTYAGYYDPNANSSLGSNGFSLTTTCAMGQRLDECDFIVNYQTPSDKAYADNASVSTMFQIYGSNANASINVSVNVRVASSGGEGGTGGTGGSGGSGGVGGGGATPTVFASASGNTLVARPIETAWSGHCGIGGGDANTYNSCSVSATRTGGGFSSCSSPQIVSAGPGLWRSEFTCQ